METSWKEHLSKAELLRNAAFDELNIALNTLLQSKGFSEFMISEFDADFTQSGETVIRLNFDCELSDLDLTAASKMTKEQILDKLEKSASDYTRLLIQEWRDIWNSMKLG